MQFEDPTTFNEKLKYALKQISIHWRNLNWWKKRFMYYSISLIVNKYWVGRYPKEKIVSVMQEDWDNLIILDACRYDTFVEVYGRCDYRISKGSCTLEFLEKNFLGKKYLDTIYITANPFVNRFSKSFCRVISVWMDGWDDELGTVPPDVMVKYTLELENKYPDKRLIIHFIQPHYPYIGDLGMIKVIYSLDLFKKLAEGKNIQDSFTELLKTETKKLKKAYKKTLEMVLPYALKLAKKLEGKTVITADHGEAFGEFAWPLPIRIYGHPGYCHIPVLVKVPWLVIDKGERKKIKPGDHKQKIKEAVFKLKIKRKI